MNVFTRVDHAIIDYLYQPLSNMLSWLARPKEISLFCLMGNIVGCLASMYLAYVSNRNYVVSAVGALFLPLLYLAVVHRQEPTGNAANPRRIMPVAIASRLIAVVAAIPNVASLMCALNITNAVSNCSFFLYVSFLYFEACTTPPPREQKKSVFNFAWSRS